MIQRILAIVLHLQVSTLLMHDACTVNRNAELYSIDLSRTHATLNRTSILQSIDIDKFGSYNTGLFFGYDRL